MLCLALGFRLGFTSDGSLGRHVRPPQPQCTPTQIEKACSDCLHIMLAYICDSCTRMQETNIPAESSSLITDSNSTVSSKSVPCSFGSSRCVCQCSDSKKRVVKQHCAEEDRSFFGRQYSERSRGVQVQAQARGGRSAGLPLTLNSPPCQPKKKKKSASASVRVVSHQRHLDKQSPMYSHS